MSDKSGFQIPTVHVVDPDDAVRDSLRSLLGLLGYRVHTFASAEAFLDRAELSGRGCVVVEARLPGCDGSELPARLAELGCRFPVIVISAAADIPEAVKALRRGAVDFLEKPFVDRILIQRIERAFAGSSRRDAD